MKTIGILGGLGPESTVLYYQALIKGYQADFIKDGYPEILIHSIDMSKIFYYLEHNQTEKLVEDMSQALNGLHQAGADFGLIASNTPHRFFEAIQANVNMPLISIVTETVLVAKQMGLKKPGFLGTGFTMQSDFYQNAFTDAKIQIVVPTTEIDWVHDKIIHEIERGIILDATRQKFITIVEKMQQEHKIDSLVLGCTELPLILQPQDVSLPLLDTTQIHVASILRELAKA